MVMGLCVFRFCHSVIMLMTDKSDSHLVVVQLLIITCMITDWIGLHSVLLPLLIEIKWTSWGIQGCKRDRSKWTVIQSMQHNIMLPCWKLRFSWHISFCILWCGRQTKSSVGIRLKPILGVGAVKALRWATC